MRRILLVLTAALFVLAMAAPSAVANHSESTFYCVPGVISIGPSPLDGGCYSTEALCQQALESPEFEFDDTVGAECIATDLDNDGLANADDQHECQDWPRCPKPT